MSGAGVPWPKFAGSEMGDLLAFLQAGTAGAIRSRVYFEPGSPRRGREQFSSKHCIECHAIAGTGGKTGPDLGAGRRDFVGSISTIAGLMWNHSQGMTAEFARRGLARATFSGQEMADILAYLYFVNYANVRGEPDRGGEIFSRKCNACHTIGAGRRIGPDLMTSQLLDQPIGIMATMWDHAPIMERELRARNLPWPRLEQGETADLTAFLMTRRAAISSSSAKGTK
jgi:cytochrome c2